MNTQIYHSGTGSRYTHAVLGWSTVHTPKTGASATFVPLGVWMSTRDVRAFRMMLELRGMLAGSKMAIQPAWQGANVVDAPAAAVAFGTSYDDDGVKMPDAFEVPSPATLGQYSNLRFGVMVQLDTGESLTAIDLYASVEVRTC